MSSTLEQLNTYSTTTIAYTDNRPEGVKFNYPTARNIDKTLTGQIFTIERSIDIVEIIKPSAANVVFKIDISAVSGAYISWTSIPAGISITSGTTYTIYGIDSVSDWDDIKVGTIVLPATFFGSFIYTCTIEYTQDGVRKTKSWDVGNFLPEALLESTTSISCTANRLRDPGANLLVSASLLQTLYDVQLVNRFTLDVLSIAYNYGDASLSSAFTFDLFQPLSNLSNLTYQSNINNLIFETDPVYVRDPSPGSSTFDVQFTVSAGVLSQDDGDTTNSTITVSGTLTEVNDILEGIIYYPDYNDTSTISLTWSIDKDSVELDSGTAYITHTTEGTLPTEIYSFTSDQTFNVPYEQAEYGKWDVLIVGGGGGGASGGGGGGQVRSYSNVTLNTLYPYIIDIGNGGAAANIGVNYVTGSSWTRNGNNGGDTSITRNGTQIFLASGGAGGKSESDDNLSDVVYNGLDWNFDGGSTKNNAGTTISSGAGAPVPTWYPTIPTGFIGGAGGGGAGTAQAGSDASVGAYDNDDPANEVWIGGDGGNGISSNITGTSIYYGGGGGGGCPPQGQVYTNHSADGGLGGGGNGDGEIGGTATQGTDGLGGGGGGGTLGSTDSSNNPKRGGSGILILKVRPK